MSSELSEEFPYQIDEGLERVPERYKQISDWLLYPMGNHMMLVLFLKMSDDLLETRKEVERLSGLMKTNAKDVDG